METNTFVINFATSPRDTLISKCVKSIKVEQDAHGAPLVTLVINRHVSVGAHCDALIALIDEQGQIVANKALDP